MNDNLNDLEIMHFAGEDRKFGTLEQTPDQLTQAWPVFGDDPATAPAMVPESQYAPTWRQYGDNNDYYIEKQGGIGDQNGQGACGCISGAEIVEHVQLKSGIPFELFSKLSWGQLYWSLNGGRDNGSSPERVLQHLTTKGVASTRVIPIDVRNSSQRWSQEVLQDALKNVALEWFLAPTWGHVVSGLMAGFVGHCSVWWYGGDNVNSEGWLPMNPGGRRGGHSIRVTEYINENGKEGLRGPNTWTDRWGVKGFWKMHKSRAIENIKQWPWWMIRVVQLPPQGGNFPQPPK